MKLLLHTRVDAYYNLGVMKKKGDLYMATRVYFWERKRGFSYGANSIVKQGFGYLTVVGGIQKLGAFFELIL